jgi:hypothetical protein
LRDVELARSEEEVCRELVLRIPVSENLRLEIARQALEIDARADSSISPLSARSELISADEAARPSGDSD